ncbi:hypothetical protein PIB30_029367 [Stylosanthes scabra]|uniref:Uncharacterized protein n=1 Tax=Stylosanthes scabra TaxID=79078 RepID=A0ABU6TAY9_9FABA|nr:hypothetical protein [Stylosanthes scabra]
MGNCSIKGTTGECHHTIRILSDTGAILHFKAPITVAQVLEQYPGYGVFLRGHASTPLQLHDTLAYGIFYYLLPLKEEKTPVEDQLPSNGVSAQAEGQGLLQWSDVQDSREESDDAEQPNKSPHAEGACDYVQNLSHGSALEVLPSAMNGVWRVKLVIDTKQLEEILSEQVNTEALIEKMRMAATSSPTRSRTVSTWRLGWKPTLFNTLLAPVSRAKITASDSG